MADLGAIGFTHSSPDSVPLFDPPLSGGRLNTSVYSRSLTLPAGGNGTLGGIVKQAGIPVSGRWVRVYERTSGLLISQARSDLNGEFVFGGLNDGHTYYVIAFDDLNQAPDFNAVIFDQLTPV
jgi:hypothetical protein